MTIPVKRLNNGFEMPAYGLGTWQLGGRGERDPRNDDAGDVYAIESAIEHGVKHIDTAEKYAAGHAETLVGQAIKRFDRDDLFLATKFASTNARAADVVASCEASMRRMNIDHLDLYLMHSFSSEVPLEETMGAMDSLVERELVSNIGVSNFGVNNLAHAIEVAYNPIVVNQVHYNVAVREVENAGLLEACQQSDVLLMAWRPIDFAGLSGAGVITELTQKYDKTAVQIALNWLVSQQNVITLAKTRSNAHLEENLGAFGWTLEGDDIELIRNDYPSQLKVSDAVPLDS